MKTKVFVISVLALLLLTISFGEIFSAQGRPGRKLVVSGDKDYSADCDSINPDSGVVVVQHDSWAYTYYDEQQIGSMGRMIAVGPGGHRHFICHETRGDYTTYPRYITYDCKDPLDYWLGSTWIDGGYGVDAGYPQMLTLHHGREIVLYHRQDTPAWHSTLFIGDEGYICTGYFTNKYDLPDYHEAGIDDLRGYWPKGAIVYDTLTDTNYIHIVTTEMRPWSNRDQTIAYQRCAFQGQNLVCHSPGHGPYTRYPNTVYPGPFETVAVFDTIRTFSAVAISSPVSQRVAIVYTKHREDVVWNNDVFYIESTNNGEDWLDETNWSPVRHNITNYSTGEKERAFTDVAACYDYNDSLHIVWNAQYYDSAAGQVANVANLYHWSKSLGISLIASGYPEGVKPQGKMYMYPWWLWPDIKPGDWNTTVCKPSISALDPIHHPGGDPDSVYLFCTWTQFNPGDTSVNGYGNGDIYASVSADGGAYWNYHPYNLTNTKSPDCVPGDCQSEHWSSLAENMYDGDLHIEYVCDRDGGAVIQQEGEWTDNDMMYLHVKQLPFEWVCGVSVTSMDPPSFTVPPIKVSPDKGTRVVTFDITGIYNLGGSFSVTSNHGSVAITGNPDGYLPPGETRTVEATISCPGEGFIHATITVTGCIGTENETTIEIPLYVVCSHDYYECAHAQNTYILKDNGKLKLWICSNSMERVWHKWIQPEYNQQVVFAGGTFVATIAAGDDTVIARQDFRDVYTGARDTINRYCGEWKRYQEECLVQKIHVTNTYIWKTRFPDALRWYWIDVYKQIFMFHDHPTLGPCPDWKKDVIVKYIWIKFSRPPLWWPDPGEYPGHGDIYLGHYADIDAPFDYGCSGCNTAGYDHPREMIWLHGWYNDTLEEPHPEYDDFYVGLAFTGPSGAVVQPLGMQCVRNDTFLYPQDGWGWRTGQFYDLITTPGVDIHDPDSVVDRTVVLTSGMIPAGGSEDTTFEADYILIEAAVQGGTGTGLAELQAEMDLARGTMIPELNGYGLFNKDWKPPICGDVYLNGEINSGDIIRLIGYVFLGESEPPWPMECRADVTGNGVIDSGDIVRLIGYVFLGESYPPCPEHCSCQD